MYFHVKKTKHLCIQMWPGWLNLHRKLCVLCYSSHRIIISCTGLQVYMWGRWLGGEVSNWYSQELVGTLEKQSKWGPPGLNLLWDWWSLSMYIVLSSSSVMWTQFNTRNHVVYYIETVKMNTCALLLTHWCTLCLFARQVVKQECYFYKYRI